MKSPMSALQTALYARLTAAMPTAHIYDDVPQGAAFPYLSLGEHDCINWGTNVKPGTDNYFSVHVWSQAAGWKEASDLADLVCQALDSFLLAVVGYTRAWDLNFLNMVRLRDPDGITRHISLQFRLKLQQIV
jgi:hypothetical protein